MSDDPFDLRERATSFFLRLCESGPVSVEEHRPALRHLGIAALNLEGEADPDTLLEASRALPWLALYMQWERGETAPQKLVEHIEHHGLIRHLGADAIRRRLARIETAGDSAIRRAPGGADAGDDLRAAALVELADHDRRIAALVDASPHDRRDALIDDTGLLATALQIAADEASTPASMPLRGVLPDWSFGADVRPLEILARFERSDFEAVPAEFSLLGDRAARFEQSLAKHLRSHELLGALRAALAFSAPQSTTAPPRRALQRYLTGFSIFADDPSLLELTLALTGVRGRLVEHLGGGLPLAALQPWVAYLRGPCTHFAEARGITLREATNFAHYAFHLLNMCDLAARPDVALRDPLRRGALDVEDELKQFALVGQREGLTDGEADLHRYEQNRWRSDAPGAQLADRIARLCGGWRQGHQSGPPGSPPRPDHELYEQSLELVRAAGDDADAAAELVRWARLQHHGELETWQPDQVLSLLITALAAVRRAPNIDPGQPFVLDLSPLAQWLSGPAHRRRRDILHGLLRILDADSLTGPPLTKRTIGLVADAQTQRLQIDFATDDEFEAILTLLAHAEDDAALAESLVERLRSVLESTAVRAEKSGDDSFDQAGDGGSPTGLSSPPR